MNRTKPAIVVVAAVFLCVSADRAPVGWPFWGGDQGGTHYSALADINTSNVSRLRRAWTWKTGETELKEYGTRPGMFENTPLMIDNMLYVTSPYNRVVVLDPETGAELWSYDPKSYVDGQPPNGTGYVHRGIAVWHDRGEGNRARIFLNTRYRLISIDGKTGKPVRSFGDNGVVDLSQGLVWQINKMHYTETSPPLVYKDLVIVGNGVGDRLSYKNDPPGDVRAFDARTGKRVWSFHTITNSRAIFRVKKTDRSAANPRASEVDAEWSGDLGAQATFHGRLPLTRPPYGEVTAIDLNRGTIAWTQPFGLAGAT